MLPWCRALIQLFLDKSYKLHRLLTLSRPPPRSKITISSKLRKRQAVSKFVKHPKIPKLLKLSISIFSKLPKFLKLPIPPLQKKIFGLSIFPIVAEGMLRRNEEWQLG